LILTSFAISSSSFSGLRRGTIAIGGPEFGAGGINRYLQHDEWVEKERPAPCCQRRVTFSPVDFSESREFFTHG
jgi:hypothetical protein